jgi:all-trans-retinol 13,14-reductase
MAMSSMEEAVEKLEPRDMTPVFVGNPSDKDSTWFQHHPNKTVLELLTLGPKWEWFEKYSSSFDAAAESHGVEFEKLKRSFADKMWTRTSTVLNSAYGAKLPESLDGVDHFEIGSPLSFAHYYEATSGALYGLDHDVQRFEADNFFLRLRPEVPEISGLYLSGQDIVTDSLVSAMLGGLLCAQKVLGVLNPLSMVNLDKTSTMKKKGAKSKQIRPVVHLSPPTVEDVYLNYPFDVM